MTNNPKHYNILLFFLALCFCISCVRDYEGEITTVEIPWSPDQFPLPRSAKKFTLKIQSVPDLPSEKVHKHIKACFQEHYPFLEESKDAALEVEVTISLESAKHIEQPVIDAKFTNNLAHLPVETYTVEKQKVFTYLVSWSIIDTDINFSIHKEQQHIITTAEHEDFFAKLEDFFTRKIHIKKIRWMKDGIHDKALEFASKGELEHAVRELTQNINNHLYFANKKKQISLQQAYNLGTLYHNRFIILNLLKNDMGAQKDKKRAQIIFSALTGKNYD